MDAVLIVYTSGWLGGAPYYGPALVDAAGRFLGWLL